MRIEEGRRLPLTSMKPVEVSPGGRDGGPSFWEEDSFCLGLRLRKH